MTLSKGSRLSLVVAIAVVGTVVAYLIVHATNDTTTARGPLRGVACPALSAAARDARNQDERALGRDVGAAAAAAERALQRSGELFGPPELAALNLRAAYDRGAPLGPFLAEAAQSCRRLHRWST